MKTIYRWIDFDMVFFIRNSSGCLRIYRDSLFGTSSATETRQESRKVEVAARRARVVPREKAAMFHVPHFERECARKCGRKRDLEYSAYCRECRNAYAREHRPTHSELAADARKRANCRSYTRVLIERGDLLPGPCEDCGTADNIQPHHDDYDKPREIRWKCKTCHRDHHRRERATARDRAAAERESRYNGELQQHGSNVQSETSALSSKSPEDVDAR